MRLPRRPPATSPQRLVAAVDALSRPEVLEVVRRANAEYYHWEELQVRPMPAGFTAQDAWAVVKLTRRSERRGVPLVDPAGKPFTYWLPPAAQETLHEVDRWAGGTLAMEGGASLESIREQVVVSSLMEEAIATSQIEGAATTRRVAKAMLRTNRRPRDRGEQMIANSYDTMQLLRSEQDRPLTLDFIFEIQARMTHDTLDDPSAAGRFRVGAEDVAVVDIRNDAVLYTPPPAHLLRARMKKLIDYANAPAQRDNFIHPLVKAAVLHFWLAYEHPFVDGNGRTARALFYWLMLKNGYWLFEFLTVSRAIMKSPSGYYRSFLYSEHDDEDLTYSLLYQLDATKRALVDLRGYLQKKRDEQRDLSITLRAVPDVNPRQRALLEHALRNPDEPITFLAHSRTHNVTMVTARADLLDLLERRLLEEVGSGRQRSFLPAADLAARVSRPLRKGR